MCLSTQDTLKPWTYVKLCDLGSLVLGGILLIYPWLPGLHAGTQSQTAFISGAIIIVDLLASLAALAVWRGWLNLIVGFWLIISPWVLQFEGTRSMRLDVAIGTLVVLLAEIELSAKATARPRQTPDR